MIEPELVKEKNSKLKVSESEIISRSSVKEKKQKKSAKKQEESGELKKNNKKKQKKRKQKLIYEPQTQEECEENKMEDQTETWKKGNGNKKIKVDEEENSDQKREGCIKSPSVEQ